MEVKTKSRYYELYEKGFFGNKAITWETLTEFLKSNHNLVCIRSRKVGFKTKYNIPRNQAEKEVHNMIQQGLEEKDIAFNQSMPDPCLTIQGEIMFTDKGLYLLYSRVKKPMKQSLEEESLHAFGLNAQLLLQHYLSPSSLSDMQTLQELFPNSIIEFSSYSIPVGNIKGRNTVIWEVRNY